MKHTVCMPALLALALPLPLAADYIERFDDAAAASAAVIDRAGYPERFAFADGKLAVHAGNEGEFAFFLVKAAGEPTDVEVEFKLRFLPAAADGYAGIILRKTADSPGLGVSLTSSEKHLLVQAPPDGKAEYTILNLAAGIQHTVRVELRGERARIAVDGRTVLDLENLKPESGEIMLRVWQSEVEFDDLSVRELDGGELPRRNLVANGDFEYPGRDPLPYGWGIGGWGLCEEPVLADLEDFGRVWGRTTENPAHGRYAFRVERHDLYSALFPVTPQAVYTMSAMLRADAPGVARIKYICWNSPDGIPGAEREFEVGPEWRRVTWQLPPTGASSSGLYFFRPEGGTLYVDAVSVTAGAEPPTEYPPDDYRPDQSDETATEDAVKRIAAGRLPKAPELDRLGADPAWAAATSFELNDLNGAAPRLRTTGCLGYDDEALYIAFTCFDPEMESLRAEVNQRDGQVWKDDCVELFIGPSGPRSDWQDYYHLGVSVTGARYDARKMDPSYDREWQAVTGRFDDRWEAVIRLPFGMFDLSEFNLGDWTINFCRENPRANEAMAWSPTYGSFHNQDKFGILAALPLGILRAHLAAPPPAGEETGPAPATGVARLEGKNFFPFGICWSSSIDPEPGEAAVKAMVELGVNCVWWQVLVEKSSPEAIRTALDRLHRHGIRVVLWPDVVFGNPKVKPYSPEQLARLKRFITEFRDHPAIAGWLCFDEPHEQGDFVREALAELQALDPQRPAYINVTPHGLGMRIAGLPGPLLMFDRYCFGFDGSDIPDVGATALAAAREAAGRPVWAFLMISGNVLWMPDYPTPEEISAQYYLALTRGVTGFCSFSLIPAAAEARRALRRTADQFAELLPQLADGERIPVKLSAGSHFGCLAVRSGNRALVVAVNPRPVPERTEITFPSEIRDAVPVFDSKKPEIVDGRRLTFEFAPFAHQVWEIQL